MKLKILIKQLKDIESRLGGDLEVFMETDTDDFNHPVNFTFTMGDPIKVYIANFKTE